MSTISADLNFEQSKTIVKLMFQRTYHCRNSIDCRQTPSLYLKIEITTINDAI